jgi:predicted phage baseplate assembly protein
VGARLNANVVAASHGETQPDETLGHGDGSRMFQQFRPQRSPVTRLPSASGGIPQNELAVRVNGELWQEAPSLFRHGPTERIYTARTGDDGVTTLSFGDGRTGARLPSGASNVVARYRTGLGLAGRLQADQLSTLLTRPVGLRAVTNPLPTDGGADPETLATARSSAPATVRTFGRAIALQDFEDVAQQTGLVARARASWAWIGLERAVQLTVAGVDGAHLSSDAMAVLHAALNSVRDPNHPLILGNLWRVPVVVTARLLRNRAFETDAVEAAARAALLAFLSFDAQPLAHPLHLSQIVAALQGATGVAAVDVDLFRIKGSEGWTAAQIARRGATTDPVQPNIRIFDARPLMPLADLDPLSVAGLALDPDALALPAEQAFVAAPATDIVLNVVEGL